MKRFVTMTLGLLLVAAFASSAFAALRVPQVPLSDGTLQGYLNSVGESINAATDQEDAQRWASTVSSNSTFTIQVELGAFAPSNTIGIYNASLAAPPLYQVFPGAATAGWFAVASFRTAPIRVVVNLFDNNAALMGTSTYLGADKNDFGFYLNSPNQMSWTQDYRNGAGEARALAYKGTGINTGSWWVAFEDWIDYNYSDCVLFLESVNPTPVSRTTWGNLKSRFR